MEANVNAGKDYLLVTGFQYRFSNMDFENVFVVTSNFSFPLDNYVSKLCFKANEKSSALSRLSSFLKHFKKLCRVFHSYRCFMVAKQVR